MEHKYMRTKSKNNMSQVTKTILAIVFALGVGAERVKAAILIVWGAQTDAGIGLADGTPVNLGSAAKIGYFTSAVNASTFTGLTSASQFLTNFVELASGSMGFDVDSNPSTPNEPGYFASGATLLTGNNAGQGLKLYYLIGNNSVFNNSTQMGVFTGTKISSNWSNWTLPANPTGPTPLVLNSDINEVVSSGILYGSGPISAGAAYGNQYRLAAIVPEPNSFALIGLGLVTILGARRKTTIK
jgi:hypothetical protein